MLISQSYILMQVPSNLILNKLGKPAIYLPASVCIQLTTRKRDRMLIFSSKMILWGVISAATAACQSFGGLLASRFFLGVVEATYFVCLPSLRLRVKKIED